MWGTRGMRARMWAKVLVDGLRDDNLPPVKAEVAGSNPVRTARIIAGQKAFRLLTDAPSGRVSHAARDW